MRGGVRRLLAARRLRAGRDERGELAAATARARRGRLAVLTDHGTLPWDADAFARAAGASCGGRRRAIAADALATATDILDRGRSRARSARPARRAGAAALGRRRTGAPRPAGGPRFVVAAGHARLADVLRYVRGIEYRVERLTEDVARDLRRMAEVVPLEAAATRDASLVELRWKLEELRVSLFAQPIGAKGSVSAVRLARELAAVHPSV